MDSVIRFSVFEADMHARELRKQGLRIKLADQPFSILAMLLTDRARWSRGRSCKSNCGLRTRSWISTVD